MLRSQSCDYSDVHVVVKRRIADEDTNDANKGNKKLALKNNALFRSCISNIKHILIDNAEDPDFIMPMHNLLK